MLKDRSTPGYKLTIVFRVFVCFSDVRLKKGVLVSDIIPCLIKHVYIMQVDERSTVDEYVVNLFSDDGVTSLAEALESKGFIEFLDEPYELVMH